MYRHEIKGGWLMVTVNEKEKVFHLNNGRISYLFYVMESGQLGHLYFGKALNPEGNYLHMVEKAHRPMSVCIREGDLYTCLLYTSPSPRD